MTPRKNYLPGNLFPVMGFLALASTLTAQPVVEDFEKPESKFSLVRRQNATANNAQLVRGEQTPSDPEMGHAHAAGFALKLTNSAKESDLNAVLPNKITREEIAQLGGVLFSADIYLPAAGEPHPATALSVPSVTAKSHYAMYRFGVTDNAAQVFFSFSNGVDPAAILHHKVPAEQLPLRRPGWNRFQILVTPNNLLVCGVNGEQTSFSPMPEATLNDLGVGVSVNSKTVFGSVYADSLTIQPAPTMEFTRLGDASSTVGSAPVSAPKIAQPTPQAVAVSNPPAAPVAATSTAAGELTWQTDTQQAWTKTQQTKQPLIVLFTNSKFDSHREALQLLNQNAPLKSALEKQNILLLDVSTPKGEDGALRFKVYQIPSIVRIGSDGVEQSRLALKMGETTAEDVLTVVK